MSGIDPQATSQLNLDKAFWEFWVWAHFAPVGGDETSGPGPLSRFGEIIGDTIRSMDQEVSKSIDEFRTQYNLPNWNPWEDTNRVSDLKNFLDKKNSRARWIREDFKEFNELSRRLRYAFVVTVFSVLENRLNAICEKMPKLKGMIELGELRSPDQSIERARDYMEKVLGLKVPVDSSMWREIKILKTLRNVMAHNDGKPKRENDQSTLVEYAGNHPDRLSFNRQREVEIGPAYFDFILDQANKFFEELYESNQDRLEELIDQYITQKSQSTSSQE